MEVEWSICVFLIWIFILIIDSCSISSKRDSPLIVTGGGYVEAWGQACTAEAAAQAPHLLVLTQELYA